MANFITRHLTRSCALCTGAVLLCCGCVDNSYDFSQDLDLTMGLGSSGLSVRVGNTEPILLENLLEVDKSVQLDAANRYYLVESGTTDVNMHVATVQNTFTNPEVQTDYRVLSYEDTRTQLEAYTGQTIPDGTTLSIPGNFAPHGEADGESSVNFTINDISSDIKHIEQATLSPTPINIVLEVKKSSPAIDFEVAEINDLRIEFPPFLRVSDATAGTLNGNVLTLPHISRPQGSICQVTAHTVVLGDYGTPSADGTISMPAAYRTISMSGRVTFRANSNFPMSTDDYADIALGVNVGNSGIHEEVRVDIDQVTGRFDPAINPEVSPISIAESLPDFLQDDEVRISVTNPTIKFAADMSQIPADLDFRAELTAEKPADPTFTPRTVSLPQSGTAELLKQQHNVVYFYQGDAPYDPHYADERNPVNHHVTDIASLIERLPDHIRVDLGNGNLRVKQDRMHTLHLGTDYSAQAAYDIYVPFEFNEGLTIVYNDSTDSMQDDLKDYQAEGVRINATVENTIPLGLTATITALDAQGNPLPQVRFTQADIRAGSDEAGTSPALTDIVLEGRLDNPADLSRIDRLAFRIVAASGESTQAHTLRSTQYLRLTDIKLRLTGQVIANFN